NWGGGLDVELSDDTFIGAEAVRRHTIEDNISTRTTYSIDFDNLSESNSATLVDDYETHFDQDIMSSYLYHVFTDRIVGAVEWSWSKFENTDVEDFQNLELHQVAHTVRYLDPSGWFTFGTGTWRQQQLDKSFFFEDQVSDFWLFDAGIGYRIPKRHGSIIAKVTNIFDQDFTYDQSLGYYEFVSPDVAFEIAFSINF
ncbi:MAG: hypothetical protein KDD53_12455, partial [Bdellovibrionales bacterium]|nr:hypothetical protein [Bdellovibrionales bacterium]